MIVIEARGNNNSINKKVNKMKKKLSVTVERNLIDELDKVLVGSTFRNKSHLVEVAIEKYLEDSFMDDSEEEDV